MNEEQFEQLQTAIQLAVDSGQFAIAVTYCDAKEVKQFLHAVDFPRGDAGEAALMFLHSLLPKN